MSEDFFINSLVVITIALVMLVGVRIAWAFA